MRAVKKAGPRIGLRTAMTVGALTAVGTIALTTATPVFAATTDASASTAAPASAAGSTAAYVTASFQDGQSSLAKWQHTYQAAEHEKALRAAKATAAHAKPTAAHATKKTTVTALTCNTSSGLLPQNVTAIVSFLLAHGYSHNAAAGIAGNMYQESKGDPEAVGMGGGGLIGFTPLPAGYVTGNPTADLQMQLQAVLTYNQQWASYLPALNSAASPADAAYIYVTYFERAGIPAASTREASADDVASACGI